MPAIKKRNNPDIEKERKKAEFDVEEFATWWHGGSKKLKEKREIEKYIFNDPDLQDDIPVHYKSYQDMYDYTVKKSCILANKLRKLQQDRNPGGTNIFPDNMLGAVSGSLTPQGTPFLVHFSMFAQVIEGQGTPEQIAKWMPRIKKCNIIGTYAQTELGHGTFLRGLETRADYDPKTDEFILHSPTLTAYKWWPGGLGHTVNYAVVAAQLYIDNKPQGIQMFIAQLRNEETHLPLRGIKIGEIGNKLGFQTVNNGYLGFENYRIPREYMLMKNAQVLRDGTFKKSPSSVLTYFTMVQTRVAIVWTSFGGLTRAATIATRYSVVRRQSLINPKDPEHQIIDHLTQQMKLFPEIARGVVLKLSAEYITSMLDEIKRDLGKGDLSRLSEMHALSSCLKAIATNDAAKGIETVRLACGGHGYMLASNLPIIYSSITAAETYEGENTVLLLQTARFLIKSWPLALKGEKLPPTVAYLTETIQLKSFPKWDGSWQCLVKALQFTAANKIRTVFNNQELKKKQLKGTKEEIANLTSIELAAAANLHCRSFIASTAVQQIQSANVSGNLQRILNDLLELHLVDTCLRNLSDILRFIALSEEDISNLQARLEAVLARIRPNAVAIVDGFDYHDRTLNSVLGSYDGNVYERIFESAQQSPMNKIPVQKSFHEHLKPFMQSNL